MLDSGQDSHRLSGWVRPGPGPKHVEGVDPMDGSSVQRSHESSGQSGLPGKRAALCECRYRQTHSKDRGNQAQAAPLPKPGAQPTESASACRSPGSWGYTMLSIVWKHTRGVTGRMESLTDKHQSQDAQHNRLDVGRTPQPQRELSPPSWKKTPEAGSGDTPATFFPFKNNFDADIAENEI